MQKLQQQFAKVAVVVPIVLFAANFNHFERTVICNFERFGCSGRYHGNI